LLSEINVRSLMYLSIGLMDKHTSKLINIIVQHHACIMITYTKEAKSYSYYIMSRLHVN